MRRGERDSYLMIVLEGGDGFGNGSSQVRPRWHGGEMVTVLESVTYRAGGILSCVLMLFVIKRRYPF